MTIILLERMHLDKLAISDNLIGRVLANAQGRYREALSFGHPDAYAIGEKIRIQGNKLIASHPGAIQAYRDNYPKTEQLGKGLFGKTNLHNLPKVTQALPPPSKSLMKAYELLGKLRNINPKELVPNIKPALENMGRHKGDIAFITAMAALAGAKLYTISQDNKKRH